MGEPIAEVAAPSPPIFPQNTTDRILQDIYYELRTANEHLKSIDDRMIDVDQRLTKFQASPFFSKFFGSRGANGRNV